MERTRNAARDVRGLLLVLESSPLVRNCLEGVLKRPRVSSGTTPVMLLTGAVALMIAVLGSELITVLPYSQRLTESVSQDRVVPSHRSSRRHVDVAASDEESSVLLFLSLLKKLEDAKREKRERAA